MAKDWIVSIPGEVHLVRVYKMPDESFYLVVTRTVFTQPDYPCAVYHIAKDADWRFYVGVYGQYVTDGCIMADYFRSRDLVDVRNGIVNPGEDLGMCLYAIGEIIADGEIMGSKAFTCNGRWGRTDIHTWMRVQDE